MPASPSAMGDATCRRCMNGTSSRCARRPSNWRSPAPPRISPRSSATTSGAKCAWWRRLVARCARQTASPRPSSPPSISNCSSVAGASRPPARSAWPRSSSGCANCCAARSCCSTTSPSRSRCCIAPKRRAGSASSTSTAASIRRPASLGSVLSYLNTQAAWEDARALGKPLRYSFGRADREYKDRWCHSSPVFQV